MDSKFKQRIVGALVLVALAIIFVPMLFSSKEEEHPLPQVQVEVPEPPAMPPAPAVEVEPVPVPEPVEPVQEEDGEIVLPEAEPEFVLIEHDTAPEPPAAVAEPVEPPAESQAAVPPPAAVAEEKPATPASTVKEPVKPAVQAKPAPQPAAKPAASPGVDRSNLPVSWAIQLASLSNLQNAERLRDTYRARHYTAYVRSADGLHKVLIGPLIREAEAVAMCKQLKARDNQDCFVVRYQP